MGSPSPYPTLKSQISELVFACKPIFKAVCVLGKPCDNFTESLRRNIHGQELSKRKGFAYFAPLPLIHCRISSKYFFHL